MQKLSPGTLILGIFAVLFGLVAAYAAKNYLQEKEVQAAEAQVQTITVPLAVNDLPAERVVTVNDIMVMRLTPQQAQQLNVPGPYMGKTSEIIGRTLREPVPRGQVFQINSLYPAGLGPSVADRLGPGERAVTIPFTGSIADTGLIVPGSMVDLLFRTDGRGNLPEATVTLLERVKVLAIGQQTFEGAQGTSNSVTLAANSDQARALKVVEGRGSLTLVLRNGKDSLASGSYAPTTISDLLGVRFQGPFSTEIYRRGKRTTVIHRGGHAEFVEDGPSWMPVAGQPSVSDQGALPANPSASLAANGGAWTAETTVNGGRTAGTAPAGTESAAVGQ